jgi:hypothetical protein
LTKPGKRQTVYSCIHCIAYDRFAVSGQLSFVDVVVDDAFAILYKIVNDGHHSASPTSVVISANVRIGRWDNGGWSLGLINWLGNGHCTVAGCGPELSAADNCGDNQLLVFEFDERIAYPCD